MKKFAFRTFCIGLLISIISVSIMYLTNQNTIFESNFGCWLLAIPIVIGFLSFTKLHSTKEQLIMSLISISPMLIGYSAFLTLITLDGIIVSPDPELLFIEPPLLYLVFIFIDLLSITIFAVVATILSFIGYKFREKVFKK